MKANIIYLIIPFLFIGCNGNTNKRNESNIDTVSTTERDVLINSKDALTNKADLLVKFFREKDYINFFNIFPDNFDDFIDIYGFSEENSSNLYDEAYSHIVFLFEGGDNIESHLFKEKIYGITQFSSWDADAYNYLCDNTEISIVSDFDNWIEYLNKKPDSCNYMFWHFIYDGPDMNFSDNEKMLYDLIKENYPNHARIIDESLDSIRHEWKHE